MKEIRYKSFSWKTHKKNWKLKKPNICQFELTFGCGLRCKHCYTDCYNNPEFIKKELSTEEIKLILDKVHRAGAIWLCLTGGDPLTREDFMDIYSYAKGKGFIITIFTNAYSMVKKIAGYLKDNPPFAIEMTLNGATKETYEKISQVKDSFEKVIEGIELILKTKLPLKIKTQITKDNLEEMPKIKKFIEGLGLKFQPSYELYARLNGDLAPCNLRISADEILGLNGNGRASDDDCSLSLTAEDLAEQNSQRKQHTDLFRCAISGGDGFHIDPYGNTFPCNLIRKPAFNLLKVDIHSATNKLLPLVRDRKFITDSKCNGCDLREFCHSCPGQAYVEMGDKETPISYYCELAKLVYR